MTDQRVLVWQELTNTQEVEDLHLSSYEAPVFVFKHSTRCSISTAAKLRLESSWKWDTPVYYLDVINYRPVSTALADKLNVVHESPQFLVITNGECILDLSHFDITVNEIESVL